MSAKLAKTFVNCNPRNMEFLRLQRTPTGWSLERDRQQRSFIYRAELKTTKNSTEGRLVHHTDGVVIEASTNEPDIARQLFSLVDSNAARNIGALLARRCRDSGIISCVANVPTESVERSKRKKAFFDALEAGGVSLTEKPTIEHEYANDPNFTWSHYIEQHSRQDKLDEASTTTPHATVENWARSASRKTNSA